MENEDKKQPIRYLIPEKAWEYFSQPLSTDDDFIKHQKILSQFYDAIINLYQIKKIRNLYSRIRRNLPRTRI